MRRLFGLLIVSCISLWWAGCASETGSAVDGSNDHGSGSSAEPNRDFYLRQAEMRLTGYQRQLARYRDQSRRQKSALAARKHKQRELDSMEIKLNEAREDLHELRVANSDAWARFRARLDNMLEDMQRSFERLTAE